MKIKAIAQALDSTTIIKAIAILSIPIIGGIIGAATSGAIGMSEAIYGAIMLGIIGFVAGYTAFDSPLEGAIIGTCIGAIVGIAYAKSQESKIEKSGIDNSDYAKGLECTLKAILNHGPEAVNCGYADFTSCTHLPNGLSEITTCMGEGNNSEEVV